MKRLLSGTMPKSEVKTTKCFKDIHGLRIMIEAGPNGWTIIYPSGCNQYRDFTSTTEANFDEAYKIMIKEFGQVIELNGREEEA